MGAPPADGAAAPRCPWCGSTQGVVQVHGHGQCRACGTNTEPCCSGDVSAHPGELAASFDLPGIGPELFPVLFRGLGSERASVTSLAGTTSPFNQMVLRPERAPRKRGAGTERIRRWKAEEPTRISGSCARRSGTG